MLASILGSVLSAVVTVVSVPLFSWLRAKANETKILNRSRIDDMILDALELAVSNVNNGLRAELLKAAADGKITSDEKRTLRDAALTQAKAVLDSQGIDIAKAMSEEATDALIRRLVDSLNVPKPE